MRAWWPGLVLVAFAGLVGWLAVGRPGGSPVPAASPVSTPDSLSRTPPPDAVQIVATGLEVPWALGFGPDGALYVTERPGRLVRVRDGRVERVAEIPDVRRTAEGGLLGLALDPQFAENQFLYLYHSYRSTSAGTLNRVVRYRLADAGLTEPRILVDNIPGARFHDGGRLKFGPDGTLYLTTGDAEQPQLAQVHTSLAGKILRIRPDGTIPADNPFPGSPVYSLGHRNPQGLAWDAGGQLWSTEHGPSGLGANCCHDEVNRIEAGENYGWPFRAGIGPGSSGIVSGVSPIDPVAESGPTETWAPASAAIVGNALYFGGLRGEALFALDLANPSAGVRRYFHQEFGRIRDVVVGPDGMLYLTTSNRDGRGTPRPDDDKILRIDPAALAPPS